MIKEIGINLIIKLLLEKGPLREGKKEYPNDDA
jgi:hypothetical protein